MTSPSDSSADRSSAGTSWAALGLAMVGAGGRSGSPTLGTVSSSAHVSSQQSSMNPHPWPFSHGPSAAVQPLPPLAEAAHKGRFHDQLLSEVQQEVWGRQAADRAEQMRQLRAAGLAGGDVGFPPPVPKSPASSNRGRRASPSPYAGRALSEGAKTPDRTPRSPLGPGTTSVGSADAGRYPQLANSNHASAGPPAAGQAGEAQAALQSYASMASSHWSVIPGHAPPGSDADRMAD